MNKHRYEHAAGADGAAGGGAAAGAGDAAAAAAAAALAAGAGDKPWYGEAHKATVEAKGWKTPDDALTSYSALEQIFGADKAGRTIIRPKDEKDAAGIEAYNKALGIPKDVAGYKVPDTLKDDPLVKAFAESSLKAGMPAGSFEKVLPEVMAAADALAAKETEAAQAAEALKLDGLKAEWGAKFDYNTEMAKRAASVLPAAANLSPEDAKQVQDAVLGSASIRKLFAKIGEQLLTEGQFVEGMKGGEFSANKQAVKAKVDKLRQDRIGGLITEQEFHSQMGLLGPQLDAA